MTRYDDWAAHLDPELDEALTGPEAIALDRITDALGDAAVWDEPPASLRDQIMAAVELDDLGSGLDPFADVDAAPGLAGLPNDPVDEPSAPNRSAELPVVEIASARQATSPVDEADLGAEPPSNVIDFGATDGDGPRTPAQTKARSRWFGTALVAAAAAVVAVLATLAIPQILDGSGGSITTHEVAGTELAPDAAASVDVEPLGAGVAITLNITGLPPAGEGQYYAGWLTSPDGEQVPIGSFHWREGGIPIELWSGVDVERYPTLGITLQNEGEPTTSNGMLVLRGSLVELSE